jgi:hypothetical protein
MEEDLFKKPNSEVPSDPLEVAARNATNTVNELQEHLVESKRLKALLDDLVRFRSRSLPIHVKALCEKEKSFLKSLREKDHSAIQAIEELYREMNSQSTGAIRSIPGDLEKLAKSEGLTLDFSRSRHPRYCFETGGFIEVDVQDNQMEAKVSTREGALAKVPADAAVIIEIVKQEKKRLFERSFAGERFLADLRSAYAMAIKAKKAAEGDPVPLREVFETMTRKIKTRKGYKSDEFLVDLSRLVVEGPGETKGYRFELQQTKDTKEGMLLLGEAGRGMVKLLIFKKNNTLEPLLIQPSPTKSSSRSAVVSLLNGEPAITRSVTRSS